MEEKKAVQENQAPISLQRTIEPPFDKIILARLLRKILDSNKIDFIPPNQLFHDPMVFDYGPPSADYL